MPRGRKQDDIADAVAYLVAKERAAPSEEQFDIVVRKNTEFRKAIRDAVKAEAVHRFNSFDKCLGIERQEALKAFSKFPESWPRNNLALSRSTEVNRRKDFLAHFDFTLCPASNLYVAIGAVQRFKILNQRLEEADMMDLEHAAFGCQYTDALVTQDRRLRERLHEARKHTNLRAGIHASLNELMGPVSRVF
jgi:hypothetical protein